MRVTSVKFGFVNSTKCSLRIAMAILALGSDVYLIYMAGEMKGKVLELQMA